MKLHALVDTGASISLLTERILRNIGEKAKLLPYTKTVRDASQRRIPILGRILLNIKVKEGTFKEYFLVLEGNCLQTDVLLGMNVLSRSTIHLPESRISFEQVGGYKPVINEFRPCLKIFNSRLYCKEEPKDPLEVEDNIGRITKSSKGT